MAVQQAKRSDDGPSRVLLVVHGTLALALTAFLLITEWLQPDGVADANIGGGLAFLGLFFLGLPWSVPAWFDFSWPLTIGFAVVGTAVNVAIHAVIVVLLGRRQRPAAHSSRSIA